MEGEFRVGYNHDFYLMQTNIFEEDEEEKAKAVADLLKHDIDKYHYPLKFGPG